MRESIILLVMVMCLSELLKRTKLVNSKFIPLMNIFMALVLNLFYRGFSMDETVLGIILGLGATGIYSGFKNIFEGLKNGVSQK